MTARCVRVVQNRRFSPPAPSWQGRWLPSVFGTDLPYIDPLLLMFQRHRPKNLAWAHSIKLLCRAFALLKECAMKDYLNGISIKADFEAEVTCGPHDPEQCFNSDQTRREAMRHFSTRDQSPHSSRYVPQTA